MLYIKYKISPAQIEYKIGPAWIEHKIDTSLNWILK